MIYLIGVHHEIQHNGLGSKNNQSKIEFISYLKTQIERFNISIIAEEFSEEALKISNATLSTAKSIAEDLKIEHRFCDPNKKERRKLNILSREEIKSNLGLRGPIIDGSVQDEQINKEQRKYYRIREKFWFDKINDRIQTDIIFVCGLDHLKSFQILLSKNKIKSMILDKKF